MEEYDVIRASGGSYVRNGYCVPVWTMSIIALVVVQNVCK